MFCLLFRVGKMFVGEESKSDGMLWPSSVQRIYYSERGASPNAVVVATAKLPKQRLSSPSSIEKFGAYLSFHGLREPCWQCIVLSFTRVC